MPDFKGDKQIKLQPSTKRYPLRLLFSACTTETSNDGAIPYGDFLISAVVKAYDPFGEDVTALMVAAPAICEDRAVTVAISWYSGIVSGLYKLTVEYITASGIEDEVDFKRVIAGDS